ncbi:MAG: SpoIIE family protein phosphatase [Actinomycetota bacterium]|nr:SpoIIE family protein phosphatase [Actinomycetota bacterium]
MTARARQALTVASVTLGPILAAALGGLTWDGDGWLAPAIWFLGAVMAASLVGGLGPAIVATAASAILLVLFFTDPGLTLRVANRAELSGVIAFFLGGLAVSLLVDHLQTARHKAEDASGERDSLVTNAPLGVAFVDDHLRFVRVNEAMAALTGVPAPAHLGRRFEDLLDGVVDPITAHLLDTRDHRTTSVDVELTMTPAGASQPLRLVAVFWPAGRGVGIVLRDITESARTADERNLLLDRVARIQAFTAGLAVAATVDDVVAVVLREGRTAQDAASSSVVLFDTSEATARLVGQENLPPDLVRRWTRFALDDDAVPHAEAMRTGKARLFADQQALRARFPEVAAAMGTLGRKSLACLPLTSESGVFGAVSFGFVQEQAFDAGQSAFLDAIAALCGGAIARARLYEAEVRASAAAAAADRRVAFLADASSALASSLDWESTLGQVAALSVPDLADWSAVVVVESGAARAVSVAHADPDQVPAIQHLIGRFRPDQGTRAGLGAAIASGQSVLMTEVGEEVLDALADDDEHRRLIDGIGVTSLLLVPVRPQGSTVGALVLGTGSGRRLGPADRALAEELATRAGQAVVNARLFRERSHIAKTLQDSLLPQATSIIPGVEIASRFVAGGEGVDVGGDFYDSFRFGTSSDEEPEWAVVIGDVRGKGVEAASLTAAARHTLRSIALLESSPARMLDHLNEVLLLHVPNDGRDEEPRFCTAVVAKLRPREGGMLVCLAVGGHPLPFVLRADGSTSQVGISGRLLGMVQTIDAADDEVWLGPGDALVLYTDGVTERHTGSRFFDEQALASVLSRCVGFTATTLAERIETASLAFVDVGDERRDDLALLVVRIPERPAASTSASIDLPADTSSPSRARRFVGAALDALSAPMLAENAELLASELVTNAVVHGESTVRLSMVMSQDTLRVSVSDNDPTPPVLRQPGNNDEHGRGLYLVEVLSRRWGVDVGERGKSVWFEL